MVSIEENRTRLLIDLPSNLGPIGLKWVYKVKNTNIMRCSGTRHTLWQRAMCSARGVDYDEVFAPVARLESAWLLLALQRAPAGMCTARK